MTFFLFLSFSIRKMVIIPLAIHEGWGGRVLQHGLDMKIAWDKLLVVTSTTSLGSL